MSKNVLIVKCDKDIPFDQWETICNYIQSMVSKEYYVIGVLKGINVECITEDEKVFFIDGDNYSYKSLKEAIENTKKSENISEEKTEAKSNDDAKETDVKETKEGENK